MRCLALLLIPAPLWAEIALIQPIDCDLGDTCYIQQYVDHDPTAGASDFTCGTLSYDGHKGTDFALPTIADVADGVSVLAAAPGTVRGVRDQMPDILQGTPGAPDVSDRECGNGVVIAHDGGYETQYCHLQQGSVTVRSGDIVEAGDVLGRVGLSGKTQFPHLHLSLRRDGQVVDPFDPDGDITCGATSPVTLWADPLPTPPGGLIRAGFGSEVPQFQQIKDGLPPATRLPVNAPALVVWGHVFGGQSGDEIQIKITGPAGGTVISHTDTLERTQAQLFRAAGRRTPSGGWPPGPYRAEIALVRDGATLDSLVTTTTVAR